ncbi:HTH-type transcriptional regulator McbR [Microbacterium hydrocarbonoxydans]|jgi:DNA-binding GntR family transcriptional regulator|uniref:HTH-type transcriptional regulator McbR n=1 Tax=Microbacterium hydrocarbonoxydans TaxID=273678 RepID=A0A0M2HNM3_9MICO|nr:GntR family transcriptional regulator [Microbacterium hydrocarbonoxydans]KJL48337.1 HTH-type transcriptional regulator McbR [Microbacterium hydrocarbonoxydans]
MRSVSDQNIAEQVTEALRSAIHSGEFVPGERLVERKLAERLGVSHIPVREALTRLAQERLITREPRRGARVAQLSAQDLEEISSLRIVLEQFMAIRVQERWNEESAARLGSIIQAMSDAEPGDIDEVLRQDRLFHETLAELAEHRFLDEVSGQLRGRITGFLRAANAALAPAEQEEHVRSHQHIVDAIASGDPERARAVITEHVTRAVERIAPSAERTAP